MLVFTCEMHTLDLNIYLNTFFGKHKLLSTDFSLEYYSHRTRLPCAFSSEQYSLFLAQLFDIAIEITLLPVFLHSSIRFIITSFYGHLRRYH